MSRICVKNLPKYASEDRLRDFFSQKGEITDAKLMKTKDGKSRQFAFIGFRTEREAEEALKFFNNSYMDTHRIICEVARKVGDPNIPCPWSRYSAKEEESLNENNKILVGEKSHNLQKGLKPGNNEAKKSKSSENNNPQLQEFLQVMQPRAKSKIWADDTLTAAQLDKDDKTKEEEANPSKKKKKQSSKENELADETSLSPALKGCSVTNPIKQSDEVARDDEVSDMDYFKSRVKKNWSDSETDGEDSSDDEDSHDEGLGSRSRAAELESKDHTVEKEEVQTHGESNYDIEENENESPTVPPRDDTKDFETGRLFIRNLPYTANEDELLELFSRFGDVSQVHLVIDKDTKRSKGMAYVHFKLPECAVRAFEELDNSIFQGRLLHIMPAKPPKMTTEKLESDFGQDKKSFKERREEQRKASEASGDTRAWNSLFIRPDTVCPQPILEW